MQEVEPDTIFQTGRWLDVIGPLSLVILAWASILTAFALHQTALLNHDFLLQTAHLPWAIALVIFLACWQVMILAMMLPSVLPLLFVMGNELQSPVRRWRQQTLFILGYALVWTAFALCAFLGDTGVHWLVAKWWWLYLHSWVIGSVLLTSAGLFQLSPFKQYYVRRCCFPFDRCLSKGEHTLEATWSQGIRYGICCLGSCWALMLVLFALGMTHPVWMVLGASIMLAEKAMPSRLHVSQVISVVFLLLALTWSILSSGLG